jgi:hypothetical protein
MTETADLQNIDGLKQFRNEKNPQVRLETSGYYETLQDIYKGMSDPDLVQKGLVALNDSMYVELKRRMPYPLSVFAGFRKEVSPAGFDKYFNSNQEFGMDAARKQERPYKAILTTVLRETEKKTGFGEVSYAWGVGAAAFLENLKARRPFKDYSANVGEHGEYTHRIQWWIVCNHILHKSANSAAYYAECAEWSCELQDRNNRKIYLWDLLFDSALNTTGERSEKARGRSPGYVFEQCRVLDDNSSLLAVFLNYRVAKAVSFNQGMASQQAFSNKLTKMDIPPGILERAARRFYDRTFAQLPPDFQNRLCEHLLKVGFTDDKGNA